MRRCEPGCYAQLFVGGQDQETGEPWKQEAPDSFVTHCLPLSLGFSLAATSAARLKSQCPTSGTKLAVPRKRRMSRMLCDKGEFLCSLNESVCPAIGAKLALLPKHLGISHALMTENRSLFSDTPRPQKVTNDRR